MGSTFNEQSELYLYLYDHDGPDEHGENYLSGSVDEALVYENVTDSSTLYLEIIGYGMGYLSAVFDVEYTVECPNR